jgi:hypothetical protein
MNNAQKPSDSDIESEVVREKQHFKILTNISRATVMRFQRRHVVEHRAARPLHFSYTKYVLGFYFPFPSAFPKGQ